MNVLEPAAILVIGFVGSAEFGSAALVHPVIRRLTAHSTTRRGTIMNAAAETRIAEVRTRRRLHSSTNWLIVVGAIGLSMTITTRVLGSLDLLPADAVPTRLLLFTGVLGLVILAGNVIVTQFWIFRAEKSGSREALGFATQTVGWADVIFTAPGILLCVVSGLTLVEQLSDHSPWVLGAEICFISAGVVWLLLLVPAQNAMALAGSEGRLDDRFHRILHRWYLFGILATVLTIAAVVFAVFQPGS